MNMIVRSALLLLMPWFVATASAAPKELDWEDLVPEEERDRPPVYYDSGIPELHDGSFLEQAQQSYGVIEALNGLQVRIPGFVVPVSWDPEAGLREALLVPYMGACIHMPPPPPNQIVFIKSEDPMPVDDIWQPYWLVGTLSTEAVDNELGNAAYTLQVEKIEEYDW